MGKHSIILAAGLVLATAATLQSGLGQPALAAGTTRYVITDLGTLGGSFTDAGNLNERGEVTGIGASPGDTALRGFVWKGGRLTDIGTLGGTQAGAGAINNSGQFSGTSNLTVAAPPSIFNQDSVFCNPPMVAGEPITACRAFLADHGKLKDLGTLGGLNSAAANKGINEQGHVVGVAETSTVDPASPYGAPVFHAFLWRHGRMLDLGTSGRGPDSFASAVNDRDQVAGADIAGNPATFQHSFAWLWQDGKKTALGTLGGSWSGPVAINNRGQVVGQSFLAGDTLVHPFLWQHGRMTDLGLLPGDTQGIGIDITDQGTVLGLSCLERCRPVLWQAGQVVDLTPAIPASSGWEVFDVQAINARGQIVGGGNHNGEFHAFLMTPVR